MHILLNWLWLGMLVAMGTEALVRIGRLSPRSRYRLWCTAGALVLCLPAAPLAVQLLQMLGARDADTSTGPVFVVAVPERSWMTSAVLPSLGLLWLGVSLTRLVLAAVRLRRARQDARPFPPDTEARLSHWNRLRETGRRARLVTSERVSAAAVFGGRRPLIAVSPRLLSALEPADLDCIVLHEWAHIQRRDDIAHVLQWGARAIAGWHPALWWIDRRAHLEREVACDEEVLRISGSGKAYASCLVAVAALAPRGVKLLPAPGALSAVPLRTRIVRILALKNARATAWSMATARLGPTLLATLALGLTALAGIKVVAIEPAAWPPLALGPAVELLPKALVPGSSSQPRAAQPSRPDGGDRQASPAPATPQSTPLSVPVAVPLDADMLSHTTNTDEVADRRARPADESTPRIADSTPEPLAGVQLEPAALSVPATEATTPWGAAADAGVAIGQGSRRGAVATAGFFTRVGKKIAGSF